MFQKTSSPASLARATNINNMFRLLPRQQLPQPLHPLRLYNSSPPASTVASLCCRPLSLLRTATSASTPAFFTATSSLPARRSIHLSSSTATPLQLKSSLTKRSFTSSARHCFRPTSGTMVVHNLQDRSSFESAVSSTTAAAAASSTTGQKTPLIVIDCYATWCGPCKAIAPKIVEFSEAYPDLGFYKVDVDQCPDIAQELGVRAMPTFIFFKDGQKVDEVLGAVPPAIEAAIKKHAS
ncbi:thioredoxin [Emergomyces pasteurianus Ep9510]|uniref:Thioredoxin n=1 Tax=Emergomyces pasteurianus Ep9510 TaxID=1447872 RepID=A0A1J9Q0V8_9EURO|nr:thioredoxin [Emergomyces pasteurianus Ep9510]